MGQLDDNLLFRWFVGLNIDDPIWELTVFTKTASVYSVGTLPKTSFKPCSSRQKSVTTWAFACQFDSSC